MPTGIDPTVDLVFKRLFGTPPNSGLTVSLVNAVLGPSEGKRSKDMHLLNPYSESEFADQKVSIYDIRGRDQGGQQFHLEMQRSVPWSFTRRVVYYWATVHGSQMLRGDYYETLRPTHSICFLLDSWSESPVWHHRFGLHDVDAGDSFGAEMGIHLLELKKFPVSAEEIRTPLERWCYFLAHGATLDANNLPGTLDVPEIRQAMEVLTMMSQDEREFQRYLDRKFAQADAATLQHAARHSHEEGVEKGVFIGEIRRCQRYLKIPQTPRETLDRLSLDELRALLDQLDQAFPGGNAAE